VTLRYTFSNKIFSMTQLPHPDKVRFVRPAAFFAVFLFFCQVVLGDIPSGYYDGAAGKTGATLKTALYNIIKNDNHVSYTPGLWNAFPTTDPRPDDGKVWDMYSDIPGGTPPYEYTFITDQCGTGGVSNENTCYSREHSFPKSWFGGEVQPMYTDLFHIYPVDQYVNNKRSDYPYGKVGTATWTSMNGGKLGNCVTTGYTGTVFEPRDEFKGDFARSYFYMATRYENVIATWQNNNPNGAVVLDGTSYPVFQTWYLNMLISWNTQDPVSQKEIDRNNAAYAQQDNRNPYIDHPEYVAMVWLPGIPSATTLAATGITATGATLNGTVNPNGVSTTWHFDYGLTTSYGTSTTAISAGSGTSNVSVNSAISGLAGGATYHFRAVAVNSNGTTNGADMTFTTSSATLSVTPSNQNVTVAAGSTSFTVTSNSAWTASSSQAWCTVTPSGSGNGTITANYTLNPTIVQRVANVTVTVSGLSPVVVTVTQAGATPTLTVTPSNQPVSESSGNTSFSVTSNTGWTAASDQTWCTVTPSGSGNGTITATYTQNTTVVQRIANITVTVTGLTPVVVTVTQSGASPTLSVAPSNANVTYVAGNTAFTATSNTSWTVSSDQAWCVPTASGSGNGTITATFTQNTLLTTRVANLTVTVTGLSPVVVTVTQAGAPLPPEPTNYPTDFSSHNIILHWTDATGGVVPSGYLVLVSAEGFDSIPIPVDGVAVPDGPAAKNVASGVQEAWFVNLAPGTTYYFKIFGYVGFGTGIDYKTDGDVPQVSKTTFP
jgi:endonuclease I